MKISLILASSSRCFSGGRGGNGRGSAKKFPKLNRNGYMFLAFVIICLIILIVLIIVLVAVLGLIVFYILKTKGVI